jgi:hypothetical protein
VARCQLLLAVTCRLDGPRSGRRGSDPPARDGTLGDSLGCRPRMGVVTRPGMLRTRACGAGRMPLGPQAASWRSRAAIAVALNDRGIRTARGGRWHVSTVRNLLIRSKGAWTLLGGKNDVAFGVRRGSRTAEASPGSVSAIERMSRRCRPTSGRETGLEPKYLELELTESLAPTARGDALRQPEAAPPTPNSPAECGRCGSPSPAWSSSRERR